MLDPLAAFRAQPHYRRAIGRMRPIAPHPLLRRTGRCRPLRREISARPLWNATLSSVHDRAADLCGREYRPSRASARVCPKKGDPKFSAGRLSSDANPALETAQTGPRTAYARKAGRRLGATPIMRLRAAIAILDGKAGTIGMEGEEWMPKKRILLTGATGGMGFASLQELLKDSDRQDLVILVRDSKKPPAAAPYEAIRG